jgi:membrane AbrB-like protein
LIREDRTAASQRRSTPRNVVSVVSMSSAPRRVVLLQFAETMAIAAAGGAAFAALGFPAGLISGSILVVAVAALAGRPMIVPHAVARVAFVLIGILLGAVVTPEMLRGMAAWPFSVALLVAAALCMMLGTASYLRFVHGWDRLSALLGASPGSLAQVMALSAEFGLDLRAIAIVQTTRVLILSVGIPAALALVGLAAPAPLAAPSPATAAYLVDLAILAAVATTAALLAAWVRFPGGLMFGALAGSAVLHGTGMVHAVLPWWVADAAMVTLGAVAGARFANTSPRVFLRYLGAAFGSFAVAITIASCFVLLVASVLPFRVADVVVAFSPGAQDTMMVLALALHLDPVFVGAHHLARFTVVTVTIALLARRLAGRLPSRQDDQRWLPPRRGTFED